MAQCRSPIAFDILHICCLPAWWIQYVRYLVQLLVFNTFLGFTLILFFSPWFR